MNDREAIAREITRRQNRRKANQRASRRLQEKCRHVWGPPVGNVHQCTKCPAQLIEEAAEDG